MTEHRAHPDPLDEHLTKLGHCYECGATLEWRFLEDRPQPTCPACGQVHYQDPKVAAAVVLDGPRGIALGLRNHSPGKGKWTFPSGYVNRGEAVDEAAVREAAEEFRVRITIDHLIGVYSRQSDPVVLIVYAGRVVEGEPTADGDEVSSVRWFAYGALPPMAFQRDEEIVADWLRQRASLSAVQLDAPVRRS